MKIRSRIIWTNMTLNQVVAKAMKDKKFLDHLIKNSKNPKETLDDKGILLSENDMWKLKYFLNHPFSIRGSRLLKLLSGYTQGVAKMTFSPPPLRPPFTPELREILSRIPDLKQTRQKKNL
ncbi:hypothetical protein JW906_04735 [bacterium]|nr:hypothetical protein [bacterium]